MYVNFSFYTSALCVIKPRETVFSNACRSPSNDSTQPA